MARRALGPATLAVVQAVDAALGSDDATLLVACSGGADSLALAAGAVQVARRRGLGLRAVVVDHGLQPGSGEVAGRARDDLRRLGYDDVAVVAVLVPTGSGQGPEAAAREARYAALRSQPGVGGPTGRAATVLLGHTRDDQAETVLLGLARGAGARSLAGMAAVRGPYRRPLLGLPRALVRRACADAGLTPWDDPHNTDPAHARVRVRTQALPALEAALGPGVAAALARTAAALREDADALDALADAATTDDVAQLAALPAAVRARVLKRAAERACGSAVTSAHVEALRALVEDWRGQGPVALPGGVRLGRRGGVLAVHGAPPPAASVGP